MSERTFTECLRYNIKNNWNEGGLFEDMTKDKCLEAVDKIEALTAKLEKYKKGFWGRACARLLVKNRKLTAEVESLGRLNEDC